MWALLLCLLGGVLFFYKLGERDLWSSHEARAAQDAASILSDGCWGLPHLFDRQPELQKPPFYYWLVAAAARVSGRPVGAWLVRLPAAAAGLAGVLWLFLLGLRLGRGRVATLAAVILATFVHYTWLARTARIDMPLTLAVSIALGCFHLGRQRGRRVHHTPRPGAGWYLAVAYLAVAIAVLLKGPIGLVLTAAVVVVTLWADGALPLGWRPAAWRFLARDLGLWWGVPLLLAVALPWYVWVHLKTHGEFFRVFFLYHNVERALGDSGTMQQHPFWLYGPRLVVDLLPWSLALPAAAWYLWRTGRLRTDPEARFGLVWLVTVTLLLSCCQFKRADYLAPAYPGAALLLACAAGHWYESTRRPRRLTAVVAVVVLGCVAGWMIYVGRVLPRKERQVEQRTFAAATRHLAPAPRLVILFRAEDHALAFHLGTPLDTIREWENLDWWAARPESVYVVMPPATAAQWPEHLTHGRLETVLSNSDLAGGRHKHPLVLLRTRPK